MRAEIYMFVCGFVFVCESETHAHAHTHTGSEDEREKEDEELWLETVVHLIFPTSPGVIRTVPTSFPTMEMLLHMRSERNIPDPWF